MQNRAHVRARLRAQTQTHADRARRARTGGPPTTPTSAKQLIVRWIASESGRLEMRWEPRFRSPTSITRSRDAGCPTAPVSDRQEGPDGYHGD